MSVALITGANRGLGLEYTRQLLDRGWHVVACARDASSPALVELGEKYNDQAGERLRIRALDVTDHETLTLTIDAASISESVW